MRSFLLDRDEVTVDVTRMDDSSDEIGMTAIHSYFYMSFFHVKNS